MIKCEKVMLLTQKFGFFHLAHPQSPMSPLQACFVNSIVYCLYHFHNGIHVAFNPPKRCLQERQQELGRWRTSMERWELTVAAFRTHGWLLHPISILDKPHNRILPVIFYGKSHIAIIAILGLQNVRQGSTRFTTGQPATLLQLVIGAHLRTQRAQTPSGCTEDAAVRPRKAPGGAGASLSRATSSTRDLA